MPSTVSMTRGNTVVVTHVHPANAAENAQQHNLVGVRRFIKGQPQALGTVQIIIGVMVLLFGITMKRKADNEQDALGVYSGVFAWGAAFYITAGSLTVAAARRPSRCLVNCAMAFSIVALVSAVIATILYSVDGARISLDCSEYDNDYYQYNRISWSNCLLYKNLIQGVSGVLAVFSLLQVIISSVVIGYACYATCSCREETLAESLATGQTAAPYTEEMQNIKGEASAMIPPHPPAYSTVGSNV
ncbi:membrane-spanning 4-domains subfamily A member 4A-like [Solea solea]|uniref:membrane-spanning 4-domains subfamily A member 4A-like n=1 Tax=Solea solea TaxID=90069 RepID=UPI00272ACF00|nr:membrane-spanning 4-domains subfamily A member 4A-like [Solea solea]